MGETAIRREIAVDKAGREFLMRLFRVTNQTIYNSLDLGNPETEVRKRIRKAALEHGGEVMVTLREVETIHDADGKMIQTFPNGARIEISKADGTAVIKRKGEEVARFENVTIAQLYDIQRLAWNLGRREPER